VGKVTWGHGENMRCPEAQRPSGTERRKHSAKVQIGAVLLCKSAKVAYESIEYGVLSIGRGTVSGGGNG
jgi:hypothetical protein